MLSIVKKCSMAFALVFSVIAVVAAPIDYVSRNALGVARISTGKVIDNPQLSAIINAALAAKLQEVGLSVNDFRGEAAIAVYAQSAGNVRVDVIAQFASAKVVSILKREAAKEKNMRKVNLRGKVGYTNNEVMMIFESPDTVIFQVRVEGKPRFTALRASRKSRPFNKVAQAVINVQNFLKVMPAEAKQGMPPQLNDLKTVGASIDLQGDTVIGQIVADFATMESSNAIFQMIQTIKQNPQFAEIFKKIRIGRRGTKIQAAASVTIAEIMQQIQQMSQPAAPAAQ